MSIGCRPCTWGASTDPGIVWNDDAVTWCVSDAQREDNDDDEDDACDGPIISPSCAAFLVPCCPETHCNKLRPQPRDIELRGRAHARGRREHTRTSARTSASADRGPQCRATGWATRRALGTACNIQQQVGMEPERGESKPQQKRRGQECKHKPSAIQAPLSPRQGSWPQAACGARS